MSDKFKSLKSLDLQQVRLRSTLAVAFISGATLIAAASACSNAININPQSSNSHGARSVSDTVAVFKTLPNTTISPTAEVVALSFTNKNKAVFLLDNGTSTSLDLDAASPTLNVVNPPADFSIADGKLFPISKADCWGVSAKEIKLRYQKDPTSSAVIAAAVNFGAEPLVLAATGRTILLRVGSTYKLIRSTGKLEIVFDGALDFAGKTSPMPNISGAGLIGESGFWVTDGERRVYFIVKTANQSPLIIPEKINVSGQGSGSMISFNVVESNLKIGLLGAAVAYRKSDRAVLKTDSLGDGVGNDSAPVDSGTIADAQVLKLVTANCAGCHGAGASNGFKDATKEASWKASAAQLKARLEANSMPPGGGQLSLRQSLAAYITKVSGIAVNISATTATPEPTATAMPDPKLAEFNATYKTLIQNSCVNGCHTHAFHNGNEATYDRVKSAKTAMKTRLDNNSMPRAPVTITADQRRMLSDWLGTLP